MIDSILGGISTALGALHGLSIKNELGKLRSNVGILVSHIKEQRSIPEVLPRKIDNLYNRVDFAVERFRNVEDDLEKLKTEFSLLQTDLSKAIVIKSVLEHKGQLAQVEAIKDLGKTIGIGQLALTEAIKDHGKTIGEGQLAQAEVIKDLEKTIGKGDIINVGLKVFGDVINTWVTKSAIEKGAQKIANAITQQPKTISEVGVTLRMARESAGLTQEELAQRLKTKKTAISRIENHAEDIKLSTLERVATALGKHLQVSIT